VFFLCGLCGYSYWLSFLTTKGTKEKHKVAQRKKWYSWKNKRLGERLNIRIIELARITYSQDAAHNQ
jgi:hypothetical protein